MKKIICVLLIMVPLIFTGCGMNDNQVVNRDYTIENTSDINKESSEIITESSAENGNTTGNEASEITTTVAMSNEKFAYQIHDGIMDFDSEEGPYYIINLSTMEVVDCTSKGAKVVNYSVSGDILTFTLYSDEKPVESSYAVDLRVLSMGTLPVD